MSPAADIVVAGAGHNSLLTACYLAKAGYRCLVLDARHIPGGGAATEELVLPGFVDGHRHAWMSHLRALMVPAPWSDLIVKTMQRIYRPEDAYAGTLFGSVESVNAGITTMFDFAHTMFNDEFPDAVLRGLKESSDEDAEIIGRCHLTAAQLARQRGIEDGYRTVLNVGPGAGQSVFHLHVHLLGGRSLSWPPG